jgi:hypothetical protein
MCACAVQYFHIGVLKAMFEAKCLPRVMCGASAGSLMAAYVCCHTDQELIDTGFFTPQIHAKFTSLHLLSCFTHSFLSSQRPLPMGSHSLERCMCDVGMW